MTHLPQTQSHLREGIDAGLHTGAQLYVMHQGRLVADLALGSATPGPGHTPMTTDHLVLWMSACKPITAIAIAQQVEQGNLELDAPVADYLPRFAQHGKAAITLRHLLTHTAGFRQASFNHPQDDWQTIIAKICDTPLEPDWQPGEKAGYHVHTAWFILAELIQHASGQPYPEYLQQHIFQPLGMTHSYIGMPPQHYDAHSHRIAIMADTSKGPPEPWIDPANHKDWVTHPRPSGNGHGPTRELGRFYQAMLNGGTLNNNRILQPETLANFTARHRTNTYDHTFRHTMDWGLGFMVNSRRHGHTTVPYGFGDHASDQTFGHGGSQSSTAFADPQHQLVVALVCNGMPGEPKHQRRMRQILTAIYEDLALKTSH